MNFNAEFNKTAVLDFLKNQFLPDDFQERRETIKFSQLSFTPDRIKEIEYIGESSSLELKLYVIRHDSENDPRVTLSRETFRLMSHLGAQRALIVFHSANSDNYRLSLVTITLALKGAKTKKEYSNPRRYSFFLGPEAKTHTPEQFLSKRVSDFDDLLKRFSIEVVNKDFYEAIAIKFTELVGGKRKIKSRVADFSEPVLHLPSIDISKPGNHIKAQEFAVRLIGRLVFCWFLKKKKSQAGEALLPDSVLSSAAVEACEKADDNYYHSVLENLFFQVLNTEAQERVKEFRKSPYDKIPFLNGGLFEPHDGDYYDFDAVTLCSKNLNTLKISNTWFKDFIDILETYNFTIDENTSVDVELAVDPEMLGRIFENLLAEINPETGETARKSTGSYYTPRPIVEYMVDESLKQYLKTKTAISEDKLSDLLSYSESDIDLLENEKESIISALDTVKIIDPACGSGAFPMGMLQKIVLVLQKVDPDSKKWLSKLLDSVPDPTAREALRKKLEGESDLWNYTRKLGVIRKSIYGVDIQPIAVEISKLRFFLSLVVDERVDDKKPNRAIEPLPNLEFKFVCANTLIGLPHDEAQLFDDLRDIDALKNLRDKYFIASGNAKLKIENEFLSTQHKMLMRSMGWGKPDTKAMKLSEWEPFKNKPTGWFDPEWMFGLKEGFDVVIGNPPYLESRNPLFDKTLKRKYHSEMLRRWDDRPKISLGSDLLIYFYETSLYLINNDGVVTLITQNSWLHSDYGKHFQDFLIETTTVKAVIDSDYKYFDSSEGGPNINTVITFFKGNIKDSNSHIYFAQYHQDFAKVPYSYSEVALLKSNCMADVKKYKASDSAIQKYKWGILFEADDFTMEVISRLLSRAKQYNIKIGQGLNLTKANEVDGSFIKHHGLEKAAIPFMTVAEGAPFNLKATDRFLIDETKITASQKTLLRSNKIEAIVIGKRRCPELILPRGIGRYFCADNNASAYTASYVEIYNIPDKITQKNIWLFLNSSIGWLIREISGRKNLGGGMLKAEATDLKNFNICFDFAETQKVDALYAALSKREALPALKEIETKEHQKIDEIVFKTLGFNKDERAAILQTTKERISFRVNKSKT